MLATGTPQPNLFADPGNTSAVIFEAPSRLAKYQAQEIWIGATGTSNDWGGCNVLVSADGTTYKQIGTIETRARLGVLDSTFATGSDPDTVNSLVVDLAENSDPLESGSTADADNLNLLCYVDGELISYSACTSTGQDQYTMGTYIRRGLLGSAIGAHAAGSNFLRLDDAVIQFDYDPSWAGKTVYFKFQSFNSWNNAVQDPSTITAVPFVIPGAGVTQPPAQTTDVINPDFEISSDIPPFGWNLVSGNIVGMSFDTSTQYAGSRSLLCTSSFSGGVVSLVNAQRYVVIPGSMFQVSAAVRVSTGGIGSDAGVKLSFFDANGSAISSGGQDIKATLAGVSPSWSVVTANGIVPPGAVFAQLSLFIDPAGHFTTASWDNIRLIGARSGSIAYVIDGGGAVVTTGNKGHVSVPANAIVTGWVITADQVGSAVVDVLRSTYAGFPTGSSIAGTDKPTLSSAQKNSDSTLSGWGNTVLSAGDILQFSVSSCSTCTRLIVTLNVQITG